LSTKLEGRREERMAGRPVFTMTTWDQRVWSSFANPLPCPASASARAGPDLQKRDRTQGRDVWICSNW